MYIHVDPGNCFDIFLTELPKAGKSTNIS